MTSDGIVIRGGARGGCLWSASAPFASIRVDDTRVEVRSPFSVDAIDRHNGVVQLGRGRYRLYLRLIVDSTPSTTLFWTYETDRLLASLTEFRWDTDRAQPSNVRIWGRRWRSGDSPATAG